MGMNSYSNDIQAGKRFNFGANWTRFLTVLDERRILLAETSLRDLFGVSDLTGKTFLDVGSGSGLFSLAARRLGASVHSFDYDPFSVACTSKLRLKFFQHDLQWVVEEGSVLDRNFLRKLGQFDIVYSWGVLHHTGSMWNALSNVAYMVAPKGRLCIAIYNDQGWITSYWKGVKKYYGRFRLARWPIIVFHLPYLFLLRWLVRALSGRLTLDRGMSYWYDMRDWIGGYPFEAAKPEAIANFFRVRAFILEEMRTCGGRNGCNEFLFIRDSQTVDTL
jgi:SAM-dependent methyltransferase